MPDEKIGSDAPDMAKKLEALESELKTLKDTHTKEIEALKQERDRLQAELVNLGKGEVEEIGEEEIVGEEEDIDSFTPSQLYKKIVSDVDAKMTSLSKQATDAINKIVESITMEQVRRDVQETAARYPDFWNYQKEMHAIALKHPELSAEEVYKIAVANASLTAKEKEEQERKKKEAERKLFTEKGGIPPSATQPRPLTKEEAAEKAWDATIGDSVIKE
jgi:hypothetical protein